MGAGEGGREDSSVNKWHLIVDVAKCSGCGNCQLTVKDEHIGNEFPGYAAPQPPLGHNWLKVERYVRGNGSMLDVTHVPKMCNHCDEAPCVAAARNGAAYKRPDGITIIDPVRAKGQRQIAEACPYGSISWNEDAQIPQIWIFDAHLLDQGWSSPRISQVCPTGAIEASKCDDGVFASRVAAENLTSLPAGVQTKPRVHYRNLSRVTDCFLGGNICAADESGQIENCVGAKVELSIDGTYVGACVTDGFGDFKFDGLPPRATYRLHVGTVDGRAESFQGVLEGSRNVGSLFINRTTR
jgi:Fe-S-cluster-containing dehydrogenase component